MKKLGKLFFSAALLGATAMTAPTSGYAADGFEMWPGATYDTSIPSVQDVLGYKIGDRITWHGDMVKYFEALEKAAPDRVKLWDYGKTWEGRRLIYVAISSANNIAKLDEYQKGIQALADPRKTSTSAAKKIINEIPGSLWISYAVHGNEISSVDAAMMTAYHMLAATNDPRTKKIADNTILFLDPLQNPDGRDRFVHNFEIAEGLENDSDMYAAERNEPWPGGRTNHYLFDLNRDWFALTQPETKGKVRELQKWFPLGFVDAHEMGSDSTYYFAPEAVPYNPHLVPHQRTSLDLFGKNNAKYFDQFGWDYFTREIYDAFYPGYGASWPAYQGAVSMTYEQASSRGLKARRTNGDEFHYRETVQHHFITSMSSAEVISNNREMFLNNFYQYRQSAIDEGKKEGSYIIPAQYDQAAIEKLAGILSYQGVEVKEAKEGFKACGKSYAAGSYVIDLAQPSKRLARTILDYQVDMDDAFIKEQESRRSRNLADQIYDVTGWSLPLMYNVTMDTCDRGVKLDDSFIARDGERVKPGVLTNADARVGFLVPWGDMSGVKLLSGALRKGLVAKTADEGFTHDGKEYPAGSLIFKTEDNPDNLADLLTALAAETGADVVGADSSWVTAGPNFGSRRVYDIKAPRVGIIWDIPTASYGAGNTRFVIERQLGYPVMPIRGETLIYAELSRYDVLIMPPGGFGMGYETVFGKRVAKKLADWVRAGGVIVGTGSAVNYLANPDNGLMTLRRENLVTKDGAKVKEAKATGSSVEGTLISGEDQLNNMIQPKKESPDSVAGVLVKAKVDLDHWLTAGMADKLNVLIRGSDVYTPIKLDAGRNVAYFSGADDLVTSGYMWQENKDQLAYKPFMVVEPKGRGFMVAFTQDPTVRAYLDGLNLALANAIFRTHAHSRKVR